MADGTKVRVAVASARELEFEVEDAQTLADALEAGLGAGDTLVWITDVKGDQHGIRVAKLAFVEIQREDRSGGVGFGLSD
jgi:hypothetical protein